MSNIDLQSLLPSLIAGWEGECVEFKEANDQQKDDKLKNLLQKLRSDSKIIREGQPPKSAWRLAPDGLSRQV